MSQDNSSQEGEGGAGQDGRLSPEGTWEGEQNNVLHSLAESFYKYVLDGKLEEAQAVKEQAEAIRKTKEFDRQVAERIKIFTQSGTKKPKK